MSNNRQRLAAFALSAIFISPSLFAQMASKPATIPVPLGLIPVQFPKDNPYTPEKAALGKLLYFDTRL